MNINFKVVVPVRNASKFIEKCINSVIEQQYTNWKLCVVDDFSTDDTFKKIQRYNNDNRIIIHRNKKKMTITENRLLSHKLLNCNDDDVVVLLDGHDWLYANKVFNILNKTYQEEQVWMTWGSMIRTSDSQVIEGKEIDKDLPIRQHSRIVPLRAIRHFVLKNIPNRYLRSPSSNKYFDVCTDKALMYSAMELSGKEHCKVIKDILYVYNTDSQGNIFRLHNAKYRAKRRNEVKSFTPLSRIVKK